MQDGGSAEGFWSTYVFSGRVEKRNSVEYICVLWGEWAGWMVPWSTYVHSGGIGRTNSLEYICAWGEIGRGKGLLGLWMFTRIVRELKKDVHSRCIGRGRGSLEYICI